MRILQVKVKPKARVSAFTAQLDGTWLAEVKAMPVDGKANAELIRLIAEHFGVAKAKVAVKSGASGRMKLITLDA